MMLQFRTYTIFLLALLMASASWAQTAATSTVRGVMTDDSGAVVPAASVTLTGSGKTRTAQTQADGSYTFPGVAPGQYHVKAAFPGFAPVDKPVAVSSRP